MNLHILLPIFAVTLSSNILAAQTNSLNEKTDTCVELETQKSQTECISLLGYLEKYIDTSVFEDAASEMTFLLTI